MEPDKRFAGLPCPSCTEVDMISLDLDDLRTFRCRDCDYEFTRDEIANTVALWQAVLAWLDSSLQPRKDL